MRKHEDRNGQSVLRMGATIGARCMAACLIATMALGGCKIGDGEDGVANPPREVGTTDFVSADAAAGQSSESNDAATGAPESAADSSMADDGAAGGAGAERTVEEGDIYRALDSGIILNVNSYRGLQIINVQDPEQPTIIGRLQIAGTPVEMYVVGDRVLVLMNNWRGYYGTRYAAEVESVHGGMVASIDISDLTRPERIAVASIPGHITTSRLTRTADATGAAALYVVAGGWRHWNGTQYETNTVVQSYDVSDGKLEAKAQLNLGGYVSDIQATPTRLLVARYDWNHVGPEGEVGSVVAMVDISDALGDMQELGEVRVKGRVASQFNMDLYNGILRIVSGSTWSGTRENHLETFNADTLAAIDHHTFGPGENLEATLFYGNKAFFVTYEQTDPYHAFFISDDGIAEEKSFFIVSGWNDFFRVVLGGERLIGIGINDEQGSRTLAVSLYDITDLSNQRPLVDREEVDASHSWSEANWDHRAFSVLENAIQVSAADGVTETGIVLVPFTGWDANNDQHVAAVQIFTFSEQGITRRGLMRHGTPVRRSFMTDGETTANLSEAELSLFDTADPDTPNELGRVELAPNYEDLFVFGDHVARVKRNNTYFGWRSSAGTQAPAVVQIVPAADDADSGASVASFEVPSDARLLQTGSLLVAQTSRHIEPTDGGDRGKWETTFSIFDLSDPTAPSAAGTLTTRRLQPDYGYYGGHPEVGIAMDDCFDCGGFYPRPPSGEVMAVAGGLVFLQRIPHQRLLGRQEECYSYPANRHWCEGDRVSTQSGDATADAPPPSEATSSGDAPSDGDVTDSTTGDGQTCVDYQGHRVCRQLEGEAPTCSGAFYACTTDAQGSRSCEEVDGANLDLNRHCHTYDAYRYWQGFSLEVLNLTDPMEPVLQESLPLDASDEGVSAIVAEGQVWVTVKRPVDVEGDSRGYVRFWAVRLDLSDMGAPSLSPRVNIPGALVAVHGRRLITRDALWGANIVETAVETLTLSEDGTTAELDHIYRFADQVVSELVLDGRGNIVVSHRTAWQVINSAAATDAPADDANMQRVTLLLEEDLSPLSTTAIDTWARLRDAQAGRLLFQVPGGLLVFNADTPATPFPQAYFPTRTWPREVVVSGSTARFAAGRYGIYTFDLDEFNLLVQH